MYIYGCWRCIASILVIFHLFLICLVLCAHLILSVIINPHIFPQSDLLLILIVSCLPFKITCELFTLLEKSSISFGPWNDHTLHLCSVKVPFMSGCECVRFIGKRKMFCFH